MRCATLHLSLSWALASCIVIPLIPEIFIREGQVVRVMGLSFGYNLVEELQVNIHVAARERHTLDVERSIWLKA